MTPRLRIVRGRATFGHATALHAGRCSHDEAWQVRVDVRGRFLAIVVRGKGSSHA